MSQQFSKKGRAPKRDLVGERFERLVVVEWVGRDRWGGSILDCRCDCGNMKPVNSQNLFSGNTKSCGCFSLELRTKHGMLGTKVYQAWLKMKSRCLDPNHPKWNDYGGRGISIFQEWQNSFELFYLELGDPPTPKHSLDRIDNDRGYYPGNIKWSTREEQANNKRSNHLITFNGLTKTISQFARFYKICPSLVRYRLTHGWDVQKALTVPVKVRPPKKASIV